MTRQLPVLPILIAAVDLCRGHVSYALKIMAPWFLILVIGPALVVGMTHAESLATADDAGLWDLFFFAVKIIGWGSIAVLWHWRILRDDSLIHKTVIFDKRVWLYILKFILISVIIGGTGFLLIWSLSLPPAGIVGSILGGIGFIVMFFGAIFSAVMVGARLSVALPAIVLNAPNFGLGDAWKVTAGNGFRLFMVTFLPFLPIVLMSVDIVVNGYTISDPFQWSEPSALKEFLSLGLEFTFGLFSLTVLSLTYAFFVESKDAVRHQAS